ncbi:formate--tetrahydrofolate ligase [Helcococcus kunzii]|uniref:formate--tetrahydrofolate ligase n=1 Tax=Helcococcus kunzii TaxID=40091 RepID=UPI0021A356F0|nr:formate--tetrahydrofolate ligase [Helcococcus kunzii]MCT1796036.1 formate--tetrahydrofolate ligase [Helcococcus kunzii]MCT1988623.1 formate--tetrahydrofolate ligase [Helcococcus kunzii]
MKTDYEISLEAKKENIETIASKMGVEKEDLVKYGNYKAKIKFDKFDNLSKNLILVTSINPTSTGEGKSTVTVGLSDGLNKIGKKSVVALREPSFGPVLGRKGGATGGGYAQVVPMEEINLHFNGDLHAITSAHNAIMSLINNHIFQGNELGFERVEFNYVLDMNERALRSIKINAGKKSERDSYFEITVASEIMAILCLAENLDDLKQKIANMLIGFNKANEPIYVKDLKIEGVVTAILRDALNPNLVQSLENNPAIIHGGPFANIAHGCNSVIATKTALKYGEYVVTEAGFGADLGAEKFIDIKCRKSGLRPKAAVIVATIKALKLHGGVKESDLNIENLGALKTGLENIEKHIENMNKFNLPVIIALNKFVTDTDAEIQLIENWAKEIGVEFSLTEVWAKGGEGAIDLAEKVVNIVENNKQELKFIYEDEDSIEDKINKVAKEIYGASSVNFTDESLIKLGRINLLGYNNLPICIAKTPNSLSDNLKLIGRPRDFEITVTDMNIRSGAGFIVVYLNKVMTMPGLPKVPNALAIDVNEEGNIVNLY